MCPYIEARNHFVKQNWPNYNRLKSKTMYYVDIIMYLLLVEHYIVYERLFPNVDKLLRTIYIKIALSQNNGTKTKNKTNGINCG